MCYSQLLTTTPRIKVTCLNPLDLSITTLVSAAGPTHPPNSIYSQNGRLQSGIRRLRETNDRLIELERQSKEIKETDLLLDNIEEIIDNSHSNSINKSNNNLCEYSKFQFTTEEMALNPAMEEKLNPAGKKA